MKPKSILSLIIGSSVRCKAVLCEEDFDNKIVEKIIQHVPEIEGDKKVYSVQF
jgi:hypothetical protein